MKMRTVTILAAGLTALMLTSATAQGTKEVKPTAPPPSKAEALTTGGKPEPVKSSGSASMKGAKANGGAMKTKKH